MVAKDEFIKEITFRICSSLDINESLRSAFEYLTEHVPLDVLSLLIVDTRLGAIRRVGLAFGAGAVPPNEIIPLPEGLQEKIAREFSAPLIVDAEHHEIFRALKPVMSFEGRSDLVVPLRLNGDFLGALAFRTGGEGKYTDEQAELLGHIAKPFAIALANALAHEEVLRYQATLLDDKRFLNRELQRGGAADEIIGANTGLRNVMEMVRQVAPLNNTVLILGETGTGKELIANSIHFYSPRSNGPFIKVNCGALPENLVDSELFGHERGAFTGAVAESRGRFERADGGTIFLDEVGELPPSAQVRLLRVLQNHEVERVGGKRMIPVNIRVIAATHRNLQSMVAEGSFREDLWYRLSGFPLMVPPVRQRKEDVPALARHFLAVKSTELGIPSPPSIAPGVLLRLMDYDWPGNVRELENLVERELILRPRGPLTFDSIFPTSRQPEPQQPSAAAGMERTGYPYNLDEAMTVHLREVLKVTNGKIHGPGGAAELLGIKATTLRWRLDKLGIGYRKREREG